MFVGMRWNGTLLQVFKDGVFSGGTSCTGTYVGSLDPIRVGNDKNSGATQTWDGMVCDECNGIECNGME